MAPRRGAVESPEPQSSTTLSFNEPLSWRAGKPIATATLLDRLKRLASELRELDQEEVDKSSLTEVAKELAAQNLLNHKDNGVKAWTACCLVDILKLCAPDAPYTQTQVKNIFTLFVTSILPALSNPGHGYNTEHRYVLSSLADVKSIVLLTDVPNADDLMLHLFSSFFDITSGASKSSTGEQISKDVEFNMTQALVTLVDEAQVIPAQVIDIIMAQFLRAATPGGGGGGGGGKSKNDAKADEKQSTLLLKDLPEAYNMAKTICNECSEKMSRYVSQYFNEVMLEVSDGASKANGHRKDNEDAESDEEDAHAGPSDADVKELQKAHKLLRELWRASPAVLQNVIPQVEAELSAENVELRKMATATLGDIISGIGAAGPPPAPSMDPAAYPPFKLDEYSEPESTNILTKPSSPQSFSLTHPAVYHSFLGRKNDKSAVIRAAWTTAIGRILVTSAGGIGLNREEEGALVRALAEKLTDADEKVRLAAVQAVAGFNLPDIMAKLAPNGPVTKSGSVLCNLADRARDRKPAVRVEAMRILGTIWGVAVGEIAAGNELVIAALGAIPSRIFDAFFANDAELYVLLDHVEFEQLIPLTYPPSKSKGLKSNGASQSQVASDGPFDADKIRAERILLMVRSLDAKAKKAFFAMQARQKSYADILQAFLSKCEEFNGGVMDDNAADIRQKLKGIIDYIIQFLPDPLRASQELHKYAKMHDRRSYQLLRYAMDPKSEFKTVHNAIKEFAKRIEAAPNAPAGLLDTMMPIIYRSALIVYNRSHLPAILQFSRTDDKGLGATAQEVMNEISERSPQVLTANIKELCKTLEDEAPSETQTNDPGTIATLKACAVFAKSKTESKSLPKDRKFVSTLINYALYGTPPRAAKYAVTLLMAATERKEMHIKDLLDKTTKDWKYGGDHYLTKLAAISQLQLLGAKIAEDYNDDILEITTQNILLKVRTPAKETDPLWQSDDELDEECQAKCWALKILVNKLRTVETPEEAKIVAQPVYKLLHALIVGNGEISKQKDTPQHHKSRLRLLAAQLMLKLCTTPMFDDLLTPANFDRLAFVAQDELPNVRKGFVEKLQKYLVKDKLSDRFYTIIFLTAYEPEPAFKSSILTWIRSRAKVFADTKTTVLEKTFPRLLSLLAHHPDYSTEPTELKDHAVYILYYVSAVASEDNLGLIFKYAQSVKQARDAINPKESENLYVLSDLAQAVITRWEQKKGWTMQTFPAKVRVPAKLFSALPSHEVAQEIAEKSYLPDEMDGLLDKLFREQDKKKSSKRKSLDESALPSAKKQKSSEHSRSHSKAAVSRKPKVAKTPKAKKEKAPRTPIDSGDRRRSGRDRSAKKSYVDRDDSEDDEEMWDGVAKWDYYDEDGNLTRVEGDEEDEDDEGEEVEEEEAEEEASKRLAKTPSKKAAKRVSDVSKDDEGDVEMEDDEEAAPSPPPQASKRRGAPASAKARGKKSSLSTARVEPESEPEAEPESEPEAAVDEPEPEEENEAEEEVEPEEAKEATPPPPSATKRNARAAKSANPSAGKKGKGSAKGKGES
ncbi:Sister chromatid cohesion protein pds5 [Clarireedia jacksonii]